MLTIGVDPDLHDLAVAAWDETGPRWAKVLTVPRKLKGPDAVLAMIREVQLKLMAVIGATRMDAYRYVVESQEFTHKHERPIDIVRLGHVAAAALMEGSRFTKYAAFPEPAQWKGSVAKHAMQARLYQDLGWGYEIHGDIKKHTAYAVPSSIRFPLEHMDRMAHFDGLLVQQWKHVGDALLLAKWGFENWPKEAVQHAPFACRG